MDIKTENLNGIVVRRFFPTETVEVTDFGDAISIEHVGWSGEEVFLTHEEAWLLTADLYKYFQRHTNIVTELST